MATLVGAITFLTLAGTPGLTPYTDTTSTPRAYAADFTRLGVAGTPTGPAGGFTGKAEESTYHITVSDSVAVGASEDPIDTNAITSSDLAFAALVEDAVLHNGIAASDTLSVSLGEAVSLGITNDTAKAGSDTTSVSITESAAVAVAIDVTDTLSASASESSSVDTSRYLVNVTDTLSVSMDDSLQLSILTGYVPASGVDSLGVSITESATVTMAAAPSQVASIRLDVRGPTITLTVQ